MKADLYVIRENPLSAKKSALASFSSLCFNKSSIVFFVFFFVFLFFLSFYLVRKPRVAFQRTRFIGHVYPPAISLFYHHGLFSHKIRPDNEAVNPAGKIDVLFLQPPSGGFASETVRCE